jgi:hypothetical protein
LFFARFVDDNYDLVIKIRLDERRNHKNRAIAHGQSSDFSRIIDAGAFRDVGHSLNGDLLCRIQADLSDFLADKALTAFGTVNVSDSLSITARRTLSERGNRGAPNNS